ncbi:hypothetical protein PGH07_05280 [Sulfurovum sp. zt1-1]|uniref:Transposase IS701-like DDE domain-containing protein n=1 Tax=Sulfurovum zhangzhouensis TaxID=3019067 RepID=A0ABT7QXM4_9BACT|nr:hypothetical protein [Sulfurovum zhangzhouensis]MDM5271579.1 hypothetical protein [Sulfurovum zhangzhouensis]
MNILAVSALFAKGTNIYTQLQCIVNCDKQHPEIKKYRRPHDTMKEIYGSDNTRVNRNRLQNFILEHGSSIQNKYAMLCMDDAVYSLKECD